MTSFIIISVLIFFALSFLGIIFSITSGAHTLLSKPSAIEIAEEANRITKRERYEKLLKTENLTDIEWEELDELTEFFSKNKLY